MSMLHNINILATLRLNAHYFGLRGLAKLPILAYGKIELANLGGRVAIRQPLHRGMIKLGLHILGIISSNATTVWQLSGCMNILGRGCIGSGCKLSVGGNLTLGDNVCITGMSTIICSSDIQIGDDSIISWDVLIMDNDQHHIQKNQKEISMTRPILIGKNVWIGCRTLILKGTQIVDNTVVAADSTVTRSITESNCIYGGKGSDLHILSKNVTWYR